MAAELTTETAHTGHKEAQVEPDVLQDTQCSTDERQEKKHLV